MCSFPLKHVANQEQFPRSPTRRLYSIKISTVPRKCIAQFILTSFFNFSAMVDSAHSHEASPLLDRREEHTNRSLRTETRVVQAKFTPQLILPVAFLAALAMTSTASTSFYAYAMLLCHDPAHCKEDEQTRYAGTVAITASISNILGMLALGHLQQLSLINNKKGLLLWMATRSMSAVMLLLSGEFPCLATKSKTELIQFRREASSSLFQAAFLKESPRIICSITCLMPSTHDQKTRRRHPR
jgi:hypothetical protein